MRPGSRSSGQDGYILSGHNLNAWQSWDLPGCAPALGERRIHLWMVDRGRISSEGLSHVAPVSSQERERAEAYKFQKDRDRYLIARTSLRQLISGYLQIQPAEVALTQGGQGKPQLADPDPANLRFNLSHAGSFTMIAFARRAAVGVDLEDTAEKPGQIDLASHILSPREQSAFDALPEGARLERFHRLWTMKEAVLKALGTGFHQDPQKLDLGVAPAPVEVREICLNGRSYGTWTLFQIPVMHGYKAALAIQGVAWSMDCWRMESPFQG
jgi:4'-phosphopantetheinyl transferase